MVMMLCIYFTPLAPGKSRAFFKVIFKNTPGKPSLKQRLMARLPVGISHASAAHMDDQDAIMLHGQVWSKLVWIYPFLSTRSHYHLANCIGRQSRVCSGQLCKQCS